MLSGKTMLVTGGTGAIGSAICLAAARAGADLAFTWHRDEDGARALADRIAEAGRKCHHNRVEGTDAARIEAFCTAAAESLGPVDILVNNLGLAQVMPFALIDEEDWDRVLAINLKSLFLYSRTIARTMVGRRTGVIINLGSLAGQRLLEVPVHYATAKAGVTGFTLSLAKELAPFGIRVNQVTPGLIDGGIGRQASPAQVEQYSRHCTLGRAGTPDEVARVVLFLASERASYINAQSLTVDGGI